MQEELTRQDIEQAISVLTKLSGHGNKKFLAFTQESYIDAMLADMIKGLKGIKKMFPGRTRAQISHLYGDWLKYDVTCYDDCKDITDKIAYDTALQLQDTVTMGKVVVELV